MSTPSPGVVGVPRLTLPSLRDRLRLGRSGLSVSPVCLGMTTRETVRAAFAAGVNFFFISNDLHWRLYEPLMAGIADLLSSGVSRDEIVVAGVSYLAEPLFGGLQFDELLDAIPGLGRIDVLLAGAAEAADFLPRYARLAEAQRRELWGCRAIGASLHDRATARMAICSDLLDVAYIRYNPGHPGAEKDIFPYLSSQRTCTVFNFKSTSGLLSLEQFRQLKLESRYRPTKITDGYRFALSRSEIDGVLASPRSPDQVSQLERALASGPVSPSRAAYMKNLCLLATGRAEVEPG